MDLNDLGDGPCIICSAPGRVCSGCYTVHYCGREHQLQHWQDGHKSQCVPYKLAKDPLLGRYLIATRDLSAGTFIMRAKPLVLGPVMDATPVCLGCCQCLGNDVLEWYHCSKCGWPLCSEGCQISNLHLPECAAMVEVDFRMGRDCFGITPAENCEQTEQWAWYGSLAVLRFLLLPPKEYKKGMTLQSHLQELHVNPEFCRKLRAVAYFIRSTMRLDRFREDDIATILGIFETNAFVVRRDNPEFLGRALYHTASLMAHSCLPNARLCYVGDGFEMALMAECDIPVGSSINISYMDRTNGTLKRLVHLRSTKHFDCACSRCSDPTDLGLYMDSIRCSKCRDGGKSSLLLSTASTELTADWLCQDPSCGFRMTASQMLNQHRDLRNVKEAVEGSQNPQDYLDFIEKNLGPKGLLHSTSSYILQIKIFLVFNIYGYLQGYTMREMSDRELDCKVQLCEELLAVAKILHPGYTRTRGFLLLELESTMLERLRRGLKQKLISQDEAQATMLKVKKMLDEAASILKEPARKAEVEEKKVQFERIRKSFRLTMV